MGAQWISTSRFNHMLRHSLRALYVKNRFIWDDNSEGYAFDIDGSAAHQNAFHGGGFPKSSLHGMGGVRVFDNLCWSFSCTTLGTCI